MSNHKSLLGVRSNELAVYESGGLSGRLEQGHLMMRT